jgi:hypothetical protein
MALRAIKVLITSKLIRDKVISGTDYYREMKKESRDTHIETLIDILESGCDAEGYNMNLLSPGRLTHKDIGDIQIYLEAQA